MDPGAQAELDLRNEMKKRRIVEERAIRGIKGDTKVENRLGAPNNEAPPVVQLIPPDDSRATALQGSETMRARNSRSLYGLRPRPWPCNWCPSASVPSTPLDHPHVFFHADSSTRASTSHWIILTCQLVQSSIRPLYKFALYNISAVGGGR